MENYNVSHSVWYKLGNIWHKVFDLVISQGALKRNSQLSSSISGEFLYKSVNIWVITANNLTKRQTKEFMWLLWFKLINVTVNVRIWGHMKNKQAAALNLSLGEKTLHILVFIPPVGACSTEAALSRLQVLSKNEYAKHAGERNKIQKQMLAFEISWWAVITDADPQVFKAKVIFENRIWERNMVGRKREQETPTHAHVAHPWILAGGISCWNVTDVIRLLLPHSPLPNVLILVCKERSSGIRHSHWWGAQIANAMWMCGRAQCATGRGWRFQNDAIYAFIFSHTVLHSPHSSYMEFPTRPWLILWVITLYQRWGVKTSVGYFLHA